VSSSQTIVTARFLTAKTQSAIQHASAGRTTWKPRHANEQAISAWSSARDASTSQFVRTTGVVGPE
jgi:hypothetical protein